MNYLVICQATHVCEILLQLYYTHLSSLTYKLTTTGQHPASLLIDTEGISENSVLYFNDVLLPVNNCTKISDFRYLVVYCFICIKKSVMIKR